MLKQASVMCETLQQTWLRIFHRHSNCSKQNQHYVNSSHKLINCKCPIDFLKNCNNNDLIPIFLSFEVPKTKFFQKKRRTAFQLSVYTFKERNRSCGKGCRLFEEKLEEDRDILRKEVKKELLPSILYISRKEMRYTSKLITKRLKDKLAKLSERPQSFLQNGARINVVTLYGC